MIKYSPRRRIMQSFGDGTLFTSLNVKKKHRILQEKNIDSVLQEKNDSDLDKYFKQSLLLSEFENEDNGVNKLKLSYSTNSKKNITGEDESDIGKYFDDSVTFLNANSGKNLLSTSCASKKNKILSSQKDRSFHRTNRKGTNTTYLSDKRSLNIIKESDDELNTGQLQKNKSPDSERNTISNSYTATSSATDYTYDKESSGSILFLPLCTQDRCKLAFWGLPPNILQVSNYDAIFD